MYLNKNGAKCVKYLHKKKQIYNKIWVSWLKNIQNEMQPNKIEWNKIKLKIIIIK